MNLLRESDLRYLFTMFYIEKYFQRYILPPSFLEILLAIRGDGFYSSFRLQKKGINFLFIFAMNKEYAICVFCLRGRGRGRGESRFQYVRSRALVCKNSSLG